jgi:hypothetical protein
MAARNGSGAREIARVGGSNLPGTIPFSLWQLHISLIDFPGGEAIVRPVFQVPAGGTAGTAVPRTKTDR